MGPDLDDVWAFCVQGVENPRARTFLFGVFEKGFLHRMHLAAEYVTAQEVRKGFMLGEYRLLFPGAHLYSRRHPGEPDLIQLVLFPYPLGLGSGCEPARSQTCLWAGTEIRICSFPGVFLRCCMIPSVLGHSRPNSGHIAVEDNQSPYPICSFALQYAH